MWCWEKAVWLHGTTHHACIALDQLKPVYSYLVIIAIQLLYTYNNRVAGLLEAKGGGRKGRFQGKATKIEGRNEVSELLKKECAETQ